MRKNAIGDERLRQRSREGDTGEKTVLREGLHGMRRKEESNRLESTFFGEKRAQKDESRYYKWSGFHIS